MPASFVSLGRKELRRTMTEPIARHTELSSRVTDLRWEIVVLLGSYLDGVGPMLPPER